MSLTLSPFLLNSLLFLVLILISTKDIKEGIIPDALVVIMGLLGLLQYGIKNGMSVAILGFLSYGLYKFYPLLKNQEWLGFGDVKMMAVSGLWINFFQIPLFLMVGGGIGIGIALIWRTLKKKDRFPLGPALALALGICIVADDGLSIGEHRMTFLTHSLSPASGLKPDSIVVLIHGYGANGKDLLPLGNAWASQLPNTLFVAPDGPDTSELNPFGNQWFGLGDWDPSEKFTSAQISRMMQEIQVLTPSFNQYLDELLKTYNLQPEKLALVGFSQGAMVALHLALHRPQCAGVVAYSGAFLNDPSKMTIARPPILLIHGMDDQLLSPSFSQAAEKELKNMNLSVNLILLPGLAHEIDSRGIGMGSAFLKKYLYSDGEEKNHPEQHYIRKGS